VRNQELLGRSVAELCRRGFRVAHTPDFAQVVVHDLPLPQDRGGWTDVAGRTIQTMSVSLSIPWDFPYTAPGVGLAHPQNAVHIPRIRFRGRELANLHECQHAPWCWLCFQQLDWDPAHGTLATLVNTVSLSLLDRAGYLA
jgi:hypothetical protein